MRKRLSIGWLRRLVGRGSCALGALLAAGLLLHAGAAPAAAAANGAAQTAAPGLAAPLVSLLTNPAVATLLLALGLLLLAADALVGGLGWLSVAGAALLALFFWGHGQLGLVGWEGLALVGVGLALLAVEALLAPGVGVAGVLGAAALLSGVALSVTGGEPTREALARAGWMLLGAVAMVSGGLVLLLRALPESRTLRGVVLHAKVGAPDAGRPPGPLLRWLGGGRLEGLSAPAGAATERLSLVGAVGRAATPLRPVGAAELGGRRHEVIAREGYIGAGEPVEVVSDDGGRITVRRAAHDEGEDG